MKPIPMKPIRWNQNRSPASPGSRFDRRAILQCGAFRRAPGVAFRGWRRTTFLAFLLGSVAALGVAQISLLAQETGPIRIATSSLPQGHGLAAGHPNDQGLKTHPDVIFSDDFETGPLEGRWDDTRNPGGAVLRWAGTDAFPGLGRRCLRVEAHLDRDTGGGLTQWFESAPRIFIRFYTRFVPPCDYIHHFVTLRANRGLRGADKWSGFGGAGSKPAGDERFSTAIEPWGNWGRWPAPGKWHFYSYWHAMRPAPDGKYWGNHFDVPEAPLIPPGQWICVEIMLQHNRPGQPDGEQAFWIDGRLQGHWTGINWRTSEKLQANALTLEAYVTDRWARQPTNMVEFDNVVIARRYIGPATTSRTAAVPAAE
ncbi:MAG: hypothetical protein N2438_04480 [Limisphaera sp.]|nr:hypothetical protein [Limisphaera sp.]